MQIKRIHNFLLLVGTNIVTKGAWALSLIILLRTLGADDFGILATLWAIGTIASSFSDLGISQVLLRTGARDNSQIKHLAQSTLYIIAFITIILIVIFILIAREYITIPELSPSEQLFVIFAGISTPFIDRFQSFFTVLSQLNERFDTYSKIRSLYFGGLLIGFSTVSYIQPSLVNFSFIYLSFTFITTVMMGILIWRQLPNSTTNVNKVKFSLLLKMGIPFILISLLSLAYGRIEVTLLGLNGETSSSGAYHSLYQIIILVYSISGMMFTVIYPQLYQNRDNDKNLGDNYDETTQWLSLLAVTISPLLFIYSTQLLELIGGEELKTYDTMLKGLSLFVYILPISTALNFLIPMDMLRQRILCDILGIGITIVGVILMIKENKIEYVALISFLGYLIASLIAMHYIKNKSIISSSSAIYKLLNISIHALLPAIVIYLFSVPWYVGLPLYLLTFYFSLFINNHPTIIMLTKYIHSSISKTTNKKSYV